jgi:hypothetical protein
VRCEVMVPASLELTYSVLFRCVECGFATCYLEEMLTHRQADPHTLLQRLRRWLRRRLDPRGTGA